MDKKQKLSEKVFVDGISKIEKIFGNLDGNLVDLYYGLLNEWTEQEFKKVVKVLIVKYDRNYFPKPAVFFKVKGEIGRVYVR